MARLAGKRVVVTGGSGFLGRHVVAALLLMQREVMIIGAQPDRVTDRQEYMGRAPFFEIVPEGCEVPLYEVAILEIKNQATGIEWRRNGNVVHTSGGEAMAA